MNKKETKNGAAFYIALCCCVAVIGLVGYAGKLAGTRTDEPARNASADLGDKITEGKTLNDFFREAVRSLAGDNSTTYTLKYSSKLNSSDTELVFTFGGEKVTAVITSSRYGEEDIS